MFFRASNIRGLIILIIINILIYVILLRWFSSTNSFMNTDDEIFCPSSSSTAERGQSSLAPSIFKNSPMHDELVQLQFQQALR